ncbi:MAG: YceI family protein [Pseudomonadota bacterium]
MTFARLPQLAAAALLFAAPALSAQAAETYYTDQGHTEVIFGWSHAGVSMQSGEFTMANGVLELDKDNPENSKLTVTIDASSVSTGFGPLDEHLKAADFLDVASYPEITFVSTAVKQTGDNTADVTGDLTIHGVTEPITLATTLTHQGEHPLGSVIDYYKGQWVAFHATGVIQDHQAFGVGGFSTGPLSITINTEMKDRED